MTAMHLFRFHRVTLCSSIHFYSKVCVYTCRW